MPQIMKKGVADFVGVTPAAITKALATGRLIATSDGRVDTDEPVNAAWIAKKRAEARIPASTDKPALTSSHSSTSPTRPTSPRTLSRVRSTDPTSTLPSLDQDGDDLLEAMASSEEEKLKLTIARRQQAEADTRLKSIKEAELKARLVPQELVRRRFAAFDAAMKTHLRDLPRRSAARLHAIALAEGPAALEAALEMEISEGLRATIKSAQDQGLSA